MKRTLQQTVLDVKKNLYKTCKKATSPSLRTVRKSRTGAFVLPSLTRSLMVRRENRHPASRLTDAIFDGAQWMRDEDPADPFAEPPPSYSQDNDLP